MSYYDTASNTWKGLNAELNIARSSHSACTLNKIVYVFCGNNGSLFFPKYLNSIEMIAESSIYSNSTATWELIDVPQNDLTPRFTPTVTSLNDTEIAIFGESFMNDVIVFDTTTKTCQ